MTIGLLIAVVIFITGIFLIFKISASAPDKKDIAENNNRHKFRKDPDRDIKILLEQGSKLEAIKLYRETYDVDLKTAKEEVEKM